ncbi:hypothetical protein Rsub_13362 [Raphidocelis subcapitata]|uniref:Amine oxidase domain-containing protein n=1 Tax=Raphidocelis subcapitata TaxID=307507 RepID=A0A2V0PN35_9CHLO|nr:hypothetical protein Rsub_13362 [Raphidocelis subcapitata]|eukprot:GBG00523.1 hypothetical protein Rsub_13362 [Raphidocelis subcapitata]
MSAVGRALAAAAGPRLTALTGARAAALERGPGGGWRLRLEARGGAAADPADVASGEFLAVVTAMSANSTRRLLTGVVDAAAEEAARIQANVCWSLMVALARPLGLPFNGALITAPGAQPHAASGGGGGGGGGGGSRAAGVPEARPCAVSWVARDSSKPGRKLPPGCAETWVVHASPDWSNARGAGADRAAVAEELLAEFLAAVGQASPGDGVLYLEAHPWSNAYPLNPRPPQPVPGLPDCRGAFVLDKGARLAAAGDWALGPRAGDAWDSGREAARAVAELLL